jgi:hypothetical protein
MNFRSGKMAGHQIQRLNGIGFVWDKIAAAWLDGFSNLEAYKSKNGNCLVPTVFLTENRYDLGRWVQQQRQRYRIGKISSDRVQRLNEIGFVWVWDQNNADWDYAFTNLKIYGEQHGNYSVPRKYQCANGLRLGKWVQHQRDNFRSRKLPADRIQRLNEIGFLWDPFAESWAEGFEKCVAYESRYGDCLIPQRFKDESDFSLGIWVANQRRAFKANALSPDRIKQLDAIGFVWDVLSGDWEEGFSHLKQFSEREGHCRVPKRFKTNGGYRLGSWITNQRSTRRKMEASRRQRLEALPGWVWKVEK